VVTTQACEKYYRSIGGTADVETHVRCDDDTALAWVPQESILFDGTSMTRRLEADLAGNARFLAVESLIFGRKAMGETVRRAFIADRWRIRRNGRLLHAEDLKLSGDIDDLLSRPAVANGATAIATVLVTFPGCGEFLPSLRALLDEMGGASHVQTGAGDRIVVRITAPSGFQLRRRLIPVLDLCCRTVVGRNQQLPKIWTM
jgi:urease accessory protein